MTQWSTPPPVARWLLEHALPTDVRESVTGDLDEVFQRDCRRYGLPGRATTLLAADDVVHSAFRRGAMARPTPGRPDAHGTVLAGLQVGIPDVVQVSDAHGRREPGDGRRDRRRCRHIRGHHAGDRSVAAAPGRRSHRRAELLGPGRVRRSTAELHTTSSTGGKDFEPSRTSARSGWSSGT